MIRNGFIQLRIPDFSDFRKFGICFFAAVLDNRSKHFFDVNVL